VEYQPSYIAVLIFALFVGLTLWLSVYLARKAQSAQAYFAAGGGVHWFVNGIAFAGDYLSAASFLGICGMIAFYGYDGFLYSIGFLAGWVVALFVIAEPLKRMGKYTFADALDNRFNSRGIKLTAAISTLLVSIFYLIPQMVGAGTLMRPLLGFSHILGVLAVGVTVIIIVVTAGMVSTTYVQFIKGALLVFFCALLTGMILARGYSTSTPPDSAGYEVRPVAELDTLPADTAWLGKPYLRVRSQLSEFEEIEIWRLNEDKVTAVRCQEINIRSGKRLGKIKPVGSVHRLPNDLNETGPVDPIAFFRIFQQSEVVTWRTDTIKETNGSTILYYPTIRTGSDLLSPGASPTFSSVREQDWVKKLDFLSLMLSLFCGTASLPHILIRYYTVKDQASARKSTVVGIASIGAFYVLTLYLGLGAMVSGNLDPGNSNMAAPLLARSFGELPFAVISAIAFTTVLGTVSGLILAAAGAVAHDLVSNFFGMQLNDQEKVRIAKLSAIVVGGIAMILGILFEKMNVSFLVGWAFNVAASANLPSLIMLLFWKRTTKEGITAAILVGVLTSLAWVLFSAQCYKDVYGLPESQALVPFSQPGIVTIPLGFVVLVVVSLMSQPPAKAETIPGRM
jgi:cation/acetate symporter